MNQFFYEVRTKEIIKDLKMEGIRSQAFHRSEVRSASFLRGRLQLVAIVLGILSILGLLVR